MDGPMIILGNGCAGAECAIALRKNGYGGVIRMFADNSLPPANPMLTTYYASERIAWETLFPYGMDFYEKYGIEFHGGEPAVGLFNMEHEVRTEKGTYEYEKCLAATGASAVRPPIPGCENEKVLTVRTPQDANALKAAWERRPGHVLVVGASMVGIKVVEMFCNQGTRVTLADLAPGIFPLAASEACAAIIEEDLRRRGIHLLFSSRLLAIEERADGKLLAKFGDGSVVACDYLAMCVGVRTNLGFVNNRSLAVDRGILVDGNMRSSDPDVFAAGDAAQAMNLSTGHPAVIGLLANARDQGRAAGFGMLGKQAAFPGSFPHNITHYFDVDFVGIGDVRHFEREIRYEKNGQFCQFFYTKGKLTGINTLGNMLPSGVVKNLMMKMVLGSDMPEADDGRQAAVMQACALKEAGWEEMIK